MKLCYRGCKVGRLQNSFLEFRKIRIKTKFNILQYTFLKFRLNDMWPDIANI